ncbi:MAG: hypothetical protein SFT81_03695 [Candidatus Caenarcaniphilales bacterium]|nr:hypothetical protein [Candidatus Caenarcaniphilales bacterium]
MSIVTSLVLLTGLGPISNLSLSVRAEEEASLQGEVISIPSGASTPGTIDRGINSGNARVGDRGIFTLSESFYGIPAGSRVEFTVERVTPAKRGFDKPGEMRLKAIRVTYNNGQTARFGNAYIVTSPGSSNVTLYGNTKGKRVAAAAGKTALGAGVGALGGLVASSIAGGRKGKAAAIGAGIGGGVGLAAAAAGEGREVELNSGSKMYLKFIGDEKTNLN